MNITELIEKLELAYGCLIGSHTSGKTPTQQFESIIKDLKQVKNNDLLHSVSGCDYVAPKKVELKMVDMTSGNIEGYLKEEI